MLSAKLALSISIPEESDMNPTYAALLGVIGGAFAPFIVLAAVAPLRRALERRMAKEAAHYIAEVVDARDIARLAQRGQRDLARQ